MKKIYYPIFTLFCSFVSLFSQAQTTPNFYYGNLHSHTSYSDGAKDSLSSGITTPYQSYTYAKASLNFDFLGISEHNHYSAGMLLSDYHLGLAQADSANEDGSFVALYGMEWGVISNGGHVLVYGSNELLGWEANNNDAFVAKGDYQGLWNAINSRPGAFGMCAHPSNSDYDDLKTAAFNPGANAALVGTAFRSGPAFSTNTFYSNPTTSNFESYYKALLARGYHVGPTFDHDNHNTTFGRTTEGRLVAIAPALTRQDLMLAFRNRSFYASDDWNAELLLSVNGHGMGSIVQEPTTPMLQVTLADGENEGYSSFQLLKGVPGSGTNATVVATASAGAMALSFTDTSLVAGDSAYYFVSITQQDGDRIISAPVWYKSGPLLSVPESVTATHQTILVWPNPVNASSGQNSFTVAAPGQGELLLLDALGRVIKLETATPVGTTLSSEGLAPGIYILVFKGNNQVPVSTRVVVE